MNLELHTERLLIKPIALDDAAFMLELVNTPGWLRFIGDRNVKDLKGAQGYIKALQENDSIYYHSVSLRNTNQPVGVVTFLKRENEEHPDFGFAFLPQYHGRGLAKEASTAFLEGLKKRSSFVQLLGITLADNVNSINLLKRLGFGFLREVKRQEETLHYYTYPQHEKN